MHKRILITGGTGSLGSRLVQDLLINKPDATVVVYSRDVWKQERLKQKLEQAGLRQQVEKNLRLFIGDIRDPQRLKRAIGHRTTTIVHAAAIKYVGIGEYNPTEFDQTNIQGTRNVAEAAIDAKVERCLFISSDKACQAINLYGMTKAVGERLWVRYNMFGYPRTHFSALRYGNVFDSQGSVMHVWQMAIEHNEPIRVRTPNPTRFIQFLKWGSKWVQEILPIMRGGEIFVPNNLKAVDMESVAKSLIADTSIEILYEPIQSGEKQHEILLAPEEHRAAVIVGNFIVINPDNPQWQYEAWRGVPMYDEPYQSGTVPRMSGEEFLQLYKLEATKLIGRGA